ncbi:DNA_MISMATCH_REPAIR_2 domain-containing protein [Nitrospira tepida]|uniref:DNA_MISMATCH_REPAIR_2 domain-containing protein n=1 Tax=Nitrospira tepida TaxID=2973512 RepID=A0AA86TAW9_9BACT|nr:MutS family DNA mismatch repair protein [Nitrospira tepida]CAI4031074.1 DNA_MISMATCH_REPAIR_2 domain-containing protein [Nitrospira tepida]
MKPPQPHQPLAPKAAFGRERTLRRLIAAADRRIADHHALSRTFTTARLILFLVGIALCVTLFKLGWYLAGNTALALLVLGFAAVAAYHNRLEQRMHRWRLWRTVKQTHLARLHLDWPAIPRREHEPPADHPYAKDLDLLGPHSLLHLLDTTVSSNGRERLTSWLLHPPQDRAQWAGRQRLARELSRLTLCRDRLVLEGLLIGEQEIDGRRLQAVLLTPAGWPTLPLLLAIQAAFSLGTIGLLAASLAGWLPGYWVLSFALYLFLFLMVERSQQAFEHALSLQVELDKLGAVLAYLEGRARAKHAALRELCAPLVQADRSPSRHLRQAARIVAGLSVRSNPLAHILVNLPGPWDLYFIWRLQRLQSRITDHLPQWLDILAEIEATSACATFAYLHPTYAWPVLSDAQETDGAIHARSLGHPLIPSTQRVNNDVGLQGQGRLWLVTGSNMSGKSTFLRTIGINVCLAQAGAPVCAERFEWSWVRLRCCIRVEDSIEQGLSHFYAEVKRLKLILEAARDRSGAPVLFLIDEIFRGTNNRERLIGSQAYIQELASHNGFGLITTHDLELAELETAVPTLSNVHFQETIENGALSFDYRLRPGPCPTTNALRIMALEGLPVPTATPPAES